MSSTDDLNVVQLGRYGDLINIIPALELQAALRKVRLFVSEGFAGLFKGRTWPFEVVPLRLEVVQVIEARREARAFKGEVRVTQAWGNHGTLTKGYSYCEDSWVEACRGLPSTPQWAEVEVRRPTSASWPSTIEVPEATGIMVSLTGFSAPMRRAHELYAQILRHFPHVVNLGALKADSLFDFQQLYGRYSTLITVDTATLHLAKNFPGLRVVQLHPDHQWDWSKTPRIPNASHYMGYDEAVDTAEVWLPLLRRPR